MLGKKQKQEQQELNFSVSAFVTVDGATYSISVSQSGDDAAQIVSDLKATVDQIIADMELEHASLSGSSVPAALAQQEEIWVNKVAGFEKFEQESRTGGEPTDAVNVYAYSRDSVLEFPVLTIYMNNDDDRARFEECGIKLEELKYPKGKTGTWNANSKTIRILDKDEELFVKYSARLKMRNGEPVISEKSNKPVKIRTFIQWQDTHQG